MKKIFLFLITCMLTLCLVACDEGSNSATNNGNVGKIVNNADKKDANHFIPDDSYVIYRKNLTKTGVIWKYEYNEHGHVTKIAHTYPDGRSEDEIYDYTYNPDGSYSVHKTGWGSEIIRKYDQKARLVEEINNPNSRNAVTNTYTYVNDTTVDFISSDTDGRRTLKKERNYYDKKGLLVKTEHFLSDGLLLAYTEYYYDEYGNETTHTKYTPEGEEDSNNAVYAWEQDYDEYGRLVRKAQKHTATGGFQHEELYEYDDEARTYKVIITTGYAEYEYRPLSECIK